MWGGVPSPKGKEMHPFFVYMCVSYTHKDFKSHDPKVSSFYILLKATDITTNKAKIL